MRIAALLTCFNRREKTLECLRRLHAQTLPDGVVIETVLVDDGSKDGTKEAVLKEFPATTVLTGDGSLYWCGGMRLAWKTAATSDPDFYLLANDDTMLDSGAVHSLLQIAMTPGNRIIAVASIRDPDTAIPTYGGVLQHGGLVHPCGKPAACDTFNGNAVLIPRQVFREMGMLHRSYTHGMGDYDYGLNARRRGIAVIQTPGSIGTCPRNSDQGTWRDRTLPRTRRLDLLLSPKGLPLKEWMTYNRRNSGWLWPLRTISPYVRVLLGR